jgi:hypothetical protein
VCAAAGTYYVATDGRDDWSGTLAAPNAAKTDGPFAMVARARDAVRAAKAGGAAGSFVVELRGGTYVLPETLMFTPEDSGTAQSPVIYRAFAKEKTVLSGGRAITGFTPASLNGTPCWKADLPEVRAGWNFRQLFVKPRDGPDFERRYRPTKGMLVVAGLTYSPERKTMPHRAAQKDFEFLQGDFGNWANLSDIEVVAIHSWSASRLYVERLNLAHRIVAFTSVPTFRIGHWYKGGRNPYYIENIREEFRHPGEWYLDRASGTLYYAPLPGETPETLTVVAPRLEKLVVASGQTDQEHFVEHLRFEGIAFEHTEWPLPREGYDVSQGQPTLSAAIEFSGARRCAMERCTVAHTGAYAISLGLGCHENRIAGCFLYDLGGGGVKVGDSRMDKAATYPVLPTNNTVENNVIAGGGLIHFSSNGVWAGIVKGLSVRHNEIRDLPHIGIAVGWCWGYAPTSCADNAIEFNHIHHVMKLIQDGGGIYTLGQQPGTVIRGNVIHDALRGPFACDSGQLGIYLDEGSGPFQITDNLIYNVQMGAFNQHYGRGNVVENNIFALAAEEPITCARKEDHLSFTFRRNIVYMAIGDVISTRYNPVRCQTEFEDNIYYDASCKEPLFGGMRFAEWQATGRDRNSVIADPLFVDAAHNDFRLKPESPAFKIGFKPFDIAQAGPEPAYRNVDDPSARIAPPPVYAMKMPELPPISPAFDIDCEQVPIGMCPREFQRAGCSGAKGDFVVTAEVARSGARSLKCTEQPGLAKSFYPYLIYHMRGQTITQGKVTFSFALMNSAKTPAQVAVEIRDYANRGSREFLTGPLVTLDEEGQVRAGDKAVVRVPNGEWCQIVVTFELGEKAAKTYTVAVTAPDARSETATVPFKDSSFAAATWMSIVSAGTKTAAFFVDDLKFSAD